MFRPWCECWSNSEHLIEQLKATRSIFVGQGGRCFSERKDERHDYKQCSFFVAYGIDNATNWSGQ